MNLRVLIALALCALMARPAIAEPEGLQALVIDGDTLVVQMAELLPVGLQILVVDGDTLMVQVLPLPKDELPLAVRSDSLSEKTEDVKKHYMRPGGPPTFEEEKEKFFRQLRERGKPPLEPHVERGDSLAVKEMQSPFDIENKELRILTKVGTGILTSVTAAAIITIGLAASWGDTSDDPQAGGTASVAGLYYGTMLGFPVGVSSVDPYDSSSKTLLDALTWGVGGRGIAKLLSMVDDDSEGLGVTFSFVAPAIGSIIASEKSRTPPSAETALKSKSQARQVSFGLRLNPKGGLSAFTTLRF